MKTRDAFAKYAAAHFLEHSQEATGTTEATVTVLEIMITKRRKTGGKCSCMCAITPAAGGPPR